MTLPSTGLPELDRQLGGGVPAGSLVALTAPPDSQSELLLYQFAAANDARTWPGGSGSPASRSTPSRGSW